MKLAVDRRQTKGQQPSAFDERRYLVPSACAAARHLRASYDIFHHRDATFALLAYLLGDQGATNDIQCGLDRSDCSKNGTQPNTKISPSRLIRELPNLSYRSLAMQRMLPPDRLKYVNRSLAYHLVTSNLDKFGFELPSEEEAPQIPRDRFLPPRPIQNPECRELAESLAI
jgi:hypothetical protein